MNSIVYSRSTSGLVAFAVVASLMLGLASSATGAQAGAAADARGAACAAQADRVSDALASGRTVDSTQVTRLQGCLLSRPAAVADSLERASQADTTTTQSAAAADETPTVVASFGMSLPFLCLKFNSDGTISSPSPLIQVASGGYLGIPGIFTVFSVSLQFPGAPMLLPYVGLSVGGLLAAVPVTTTPLPEWALVLFGFQVPNCG